MTLQTLKKKIREWLGINSDIRVLSDIVNKWRNENSDRYDNISNDIDYVQRQLNMDLSVEQLELTRYLSEKIKSAQDRRAEVQRENMDIEKRLKLLVEDLHIFYKDYDEFRKLDSKWKRNIDELFKKVNNTPMRESPTPQDFL